MSNDSVACSDGQNIIEIEDWGLGVLFIGFIFITILWNLLDEKATQYFASHDQRGLHVIFLAVKEELLALGMLSLLLTGLKGLLSKICISSSGSVDPVEQGDCGDGQKQLYSTQAIYQVHVLIFTMSLTHIAYAAISMPLCIWKVKRWKEWEVLAKEQGVQPIPDKILQHVGSSGLVHWLYMIGDTVVSRGISQAKFGGIYSVFRDSVEAAYPELVMDDFPYVQFLLEILQTEFGAVVHIHPVMWVIAAVFLACPGADYINYFATCAMLLVMLTIAVKLQSVSTYLAARAHYRHYGRARLAGEDSVCSDISGDGAAQHFHLQSILLRRGLMSPSMTARITPAEMVRVPSAPEMSKMSGALINREGSISGKQTARTGSSLGLMRASTFKALAIVEDAHANKVSFSKVSFSKLSSGQAGAHASLDPPSLATHISGGLSGGATAGPGLGGLSRGLSGGLSGSTTGGTSGHPSLRTERSWEAMPKTGSDLRAQSSDPDPDLPPAKPRGSSESGPYFPSAKQAGGVGQTLPTIESMRMLGASWRGDDFAGDSAKTDGEIITSPSAKNPPAHRLAVSTNQPHTGVNPMETSPRSSSFLSPSVLEKKSLKRASAPFRFPNLNDDGGLQRVAAEPSFCDDSGTSLRKILARPSMMMRSGIDKLMYRTTGNGAAEYEAKHIDDAQKREHRVGKIDQLFWFSDPTLLMKIYRYAFFETTFSFALFFFYLWQTPDHISRQVGPVEAWVWNLAIIGVDIIHLLHSAFNVLPMYAITMTTAPKTVHSVKPWLIANKKRKEACEMARAMQLRRSLKKTRSMKVWLWLKAKLLAFFADRPRHCMCCNASNREMEAEVEKIEKVASVASTRRSSHDFLGMGKQGDGTAFLPEAQYIPGNRILSSNAPSYCASDSSVRRNTVPSPPSPEQQTGRKAEVEVGLSH